MARVAEAAALAAGLALMIAPRDPAPSANQAQGALVALLAAALMNSRSRAEAAAREARSHRDRLRDRATECQRAEASLRETEGRLQAVLDSSRAVAYLKDLEGRYVLINRPWADLFGVTKETVLGKTDFDIFPTAHAEAFRANDRLALEDGRAVEMEEVAPHADGPHTYLSIKAPLFDPDGRPYATCGISTDITERKRMEEALRRSEDRIQKLNVHLERRLRRLEGLRRIDSAITSGVDLGRTLAVIADQALHHLHVDAAVVRLAEGSAVDGRPVAGVGRGHASASVGLARRVAREGCPLHVPDLACAPAADPSAAGLRAEGFATYHAIPMIAKGRVNGVIEFLGRAPIEPDAEWLDFAETLAGQAAIAADNAALVDDLRGAHAELASACDETIEGWARALDLRDKETEGHSRRVTEMTVELARDLGIAEPDLVHVRRGALLHDIGKMGIPDAILLKPGPLTEEEWRVMRRHPSMAVEMLRPIAFLRPALVIPRDHHERWDGTGYPRGLQGEEIPLEARIFAAVDIWDALSHDRPYRPAWSADRVLAHLRSLSGSHLDPRVVELFLARLDGSGPHPGRGELDAAISRDPGRAPAAARVIRREMAPAATDRGPARARRDPAASGRP